SAYASAFDLESKTIEFIKIQFQNLPIPALGCLRSKN
ncbi:MAG: hypothetical protein ACI959_001719, partial [Limisphaerales bacterium]